MTEEQQLKILRYWVAQSSKAINDIAFIEAFHEVRQAYLETQNAKNAELSSPLLNPLGRVAVGRLDSAEGALVLFCTKALDQDHKAASIRKLRNSLIGGQDGPHTPDRKLIEAFRRFERDFRGDKIGNLRRKLIAHADEAVVLDLEELHGTTRELIEHANAILDLIRVLIECSGLIPKGTVDNPIISDNTLILRHREFAFDDARQFWEQVFDAWR